MTLIYAKLKLNAANPKVYNPNTTIEKLVSSYIDEVSGGLYELK